ncbi:hypothetical protein CEXT_288341 [Caerostris extrusa]|uniref:Uncharacterized protein n=1 Tax=Caerostris extrusa TaxID=172846 RepID=A0AAV4MN66_CAEEX|nr:hypothetical protein CEXT_288341 [Caerostris extrusa]
MLLGEKEEGVMVLISSHCGWDRCASDSKGRSCSFVPFSRSNRCRCAFGPVTKASIKSNSTESYSFNYLPYEYIISSMSLLGVIDTSFSAHAMGSFSYYQTAEGLKVFKTTVLLHNTGAILIMVCEDSSGIELEHLA